MRIHLEDFSHSFNCAIGTAFAGVKASVPDMKNSADAYFDEQNRMTYVCYPRWDSIKRMLMPSRKSKESKESTLPMQWTFLQIKGTSQLVVKAIVKDLPVMILYTLTGVRLEKGRLPKKWKWMLNWIRED